MARSKPIRVFYSDLSGRFYATRAYRVTGKGQVEVTGEKFDVTDDIANLIAEFDLVFKLKDDPEDRTDAART